MKLATDVLIRYLNGFSSVKESGYRSETEEEWHELFTEALANERMVN